MPRLMRCHIVAIGAAGRPSSRCQRVVLAIGWLLLALIASESFRRPLAAQGLTQEEEAQGLGKKKEKRRPFVLIAAKVETLEALEDFRRAVRKAKWDQAFTQIEKLLAEQTVGLVPAQEGVLVPLRSAVAIDLAALPPAGQDAYRLFHDAEAKKLWEEVQKEAGPEEMTKLSRLATLELITSVGDLAANRLGDALFEQGDLLGAIDSWQRILTYRPDSSLSRAQLLVKIGIALADAGRWSELTEVERELKERYAGEKVTVAGAKVVASEQISTLLAQHATAPAGTAGRLPADLVLVDDQEPVWQFRFGSKDPNQRVLINRWNMWGMRESVDLFDLPVSAVVGETCVYANWMGCDFAIDLDNGKMRWRNGRFNDVAQRMRQNNMFTSGDPFKVVVDGDELWSVVRPKGNNPGDQQNMNVMWMNGRMVSPAGYLDVVRRDPATGKELFRSGSIPELKEYHLLGAPVPAGRMLYLTATKVNQPSELHVLALQPEANRLAWSAHLGTYQFVPGQGNGGGVKPTILVNGPRLYVDTQAGGMVEMEASTGALRWAYSYPSKMPGQNNMWWWNDDEPEMGFGPSGPVVAGGLLLIKGMQSSRLVALRPDGSATNWKRAVPENAILAGIDDQRVYLASEELLAFDLKTQQLLWSNNLPFKSTAIVPLVTEHRYYQFTPRGVYEVDKSTGQVVHVFRGADRDSGGGSILTTPELLITVSPRAITAYPLKTATEVAEK
jgi:outer membrane protein assembly factor BamB/tetratricopeptide (TPR) repeat protein